MRDLRSPNTIVYVSPLFGPADLRGAQLVSSSRLAPHEAAVLPLARLRFLDFVGRNRLESLSLVVRYRLGGEEKQSVLAVPLLNYRANASYALPLRRDHLHVSGLPLNLAQHRAAYGQEFALDVVACDASMRTTRVPKPAHLSDFYVYGRDVRAIGDGTVIEAADAFPESEMQDPTAYSEAFFVQLASRLIPRIAGESSASRQRSRRGSAPSREEYRTHGVLAVEVD